MIFPADGLEVVYVFIKKHIPRSSSGERILWLAQHFFVSFPRAIVRRNMTSCS